MEDDTLRGIFSCDEWEEIGDTNIKQDPPLPDNVIRLLYDLNKVYKNMHWNNTKQILTLNYQ